MGKSWLPALFSVTLTTIIVINIVYVGTTKADETSTELTNKTHSTTQQLNDTKNDIEEALDVIEAASTGSLGKDCANRVGFKPLPARVFLDPKRYDIVRQKADMTAMMLKNLDNAGTKQYKDALIKTLLMSVNNAVETRVMTFQESDETLINGSSAKRDPINVQDDSRIKINPVSTMPDLNLPWFEYGGDRSGLRFAPHDNRSWWTTPYFSCQSQTWLISYSVNVKSLQGTRNGAREFLSIDIDISKLEVNQCDPVASGTVDNLSRNQMSFFKSTHKCQTNTTQCEYRNKTTNESGGNIESRWTKGAYVCKCKPGFYNFDPRHEFGFDGTLVEAAWKEMQLNKTNSYTKIYRCLECAQGCDTCKGPEPCLATYHWPFRIALLVISISCVFAVLFLVVYMYKNKKLKVFKVASPTFLSITLLGCAIMYLEMIAIFPVLDKYSCIATKWTRHLGFCISYTALLMKTWRVSLTYRVKSAHKVKLTDKQLLQWMMPILLVMIIYLGTWTLSDPPRAVEIFDSNGLKFNQCSFNWWDHSLAIGEIMFLAWGIRVCYNVRNAESLFNEAKLISYAIYNIAVVNTTMIAIHVIIFPHAGPDTKYFLGFLRTQLSTTVTVLLVFGPKMIRVLRGQGDQWDSRARLRGVTASFSLNGSGLVTEETTDLYQENEELKEEIQKLAAQIEFMKIVHMEMHNRHIKPKFGGYFSAQGHGHGHPSTAQSPIAKSSTASFILKTAVEQGASAAAAAAVEDSTFPSGSLHRARRMELMKERKAEKEKERQKRQDKDNKERQQSELQQSQPSSSSSTLGERV